MVPSLSNGARSGCTSVPQWGPGGVHQVAFCFKGLGRSVHFSWLQKRGPLQEIQNRASNVHHQEMQKGSMKHL